MPKPELIKGTIFLFQNVTPAFDKIDDRDVDVVALKGAKYSRIVLTNETTPKDTVKEYTDYLNRISGANQILKGHWFSVPLDTMLISETKVDPEKVRNLRKALQGSSPIFTASFSDHGTNAFITFSENEYVANKMIQAYLEGEG